MRQLTFRQYKNSRQGSQEFLQVREGCFGAKVEVCNSMGLTGNLKVTNEKPISDLTRQIDNT